MRKVAWAFGLVVGVYFIGRAVLEPFVIDMSDPTTYQDDWGGPSLLGVLLVHCGPGVVAAAILVPALIRRRRARLSRRAQPGRAAR